MVRSVRRMYIKESGSLPSILHFSCACGVAQKVAYCVEMTVKRRESRNTQRAAEKTIPKTHFLGKACSGWSGNVHLTSDILGRDAYRKGSLPSEVCYVFPQTFGCKCSALFHRDRGKRVHGCASHRPERCTADYFEAYIIDG